MVASSLFDANWEVWHQWRSKPLFCILIPSNGEFEVLLWREGQFFLGE